MNGYAEAQIKIARTPITKIKKISFIKRWVRKWVDNNQPAEPYPDDAQTIKPSTFNTDKGIRFNVYRATGGYIIETSMYSQRIDRNSTSLHIITEDQDLGASIGKIITMETLKQ